MLKLRILFWLLVGWYAHRQCRLGQYLVNVAPTGADLWNIRDMDWAFRLRMVALYGLDWEFPAKEHDYAH
jgi:hypothetical protein